jgi:lipoprotein-anchoring transpeptidase ErfK/SrfK
MRRVVRIIVVIAVATFGAAWLVMQPMKSAPVLQTQAVPISAAPATSTTSTVKPDAPASAAPLAGPMQFAAATGPSVTVHASPGGAVRSTISNPLYTLPLVMLVKSVVNSEWLEVHLPSRPNGSTGFIRVAEVQVRTVTTQVLVEQRFRRLSVWDNGRLVFESPVAVGKAATPTPNGTFYAQGTAATGNPRGAYGPLIVVVSSHSDVHKTFAGGDGLIGIHGTNQPGLIGQAVSNGCIRMPNAAATEVGRLVAPGSPVVVVP